MAPPTETITVRLPRDLVEFARVCASEEAVDEVVAVALELLRARIYELTDGSALGDDAPS